MGLVQPHNEVGPIARIWPKSKKKPTKSGPFGFGYFASGTLIYFKNY
jgi:hypothetical protein